MSRVIVLDTSPLGLLCHPNPHGTSAACLRWAQALEANGHRIVVPEVADYEIRRELVRGGRVRSLARLDQIIAQYDYLPITTAMMRHAAELWAQVRRLGLPTAGPESLDADAVLAAQALSLGDPSMVVATSNIGHLARFVAADEWNRIPTA